MGGAAARGSGRQPRARSRRETPRRRGKETAVGAGAPPRLGQRHPNSAARRPDPPVTELAPFSPKGKGADDPHPGVKKQAVLDFYPDLGIMEKLDKLEVLWR